MPAPFGVTTTGFNSKTTDEIKADVEDYIHTNIHPLFDLGTSSPWGQFVGILVSQLRELWEVAEAVYNAFDPDAAIDAAMVQLSLLTGTSRLAATNTTVLADVNLDAGTYAAGVLVGSVAGNPDARFVNRDEIVSPGGAVTGQTFVAEDTGTVDAPDGELNVIAEPYTGFNSITNSGYSPTLGMDIETIVALRLRREQELQASGSTNVDAIRDNVDQVDGVISVNVLENTTLVTDSNGLPGKSFEAVIWDGVSPAADDDEIAQAIWDAKAGGMQSYGTGESGTAVGTDEQNHTMEFSRVTYKTIYLEFDVTGSPDSAAIKQALEDYGAANYVPDSDVILAKLDAIVAGSDGVTDLTATRAGFSASPTGTENLTIGTREIAYIAIANIVITAS